MTETYKTNTTRKGSNMTPSSSVAITNGTATASSSNPNSITTKNSLISNLQLLWSGKKSNNLAKLTAELNMLFAKYTDPLKEYLDFLELFIDHGGKGGFSYHVTKQFMTWLTKPEAKKPKDGFKPVDGLKIRAINVASKASSSDIKSVLFSIYELADSSELFVSSVAPQLKENNSYLQLCHWVCLFNIEHLFHFSEFLYPLLLKNCDVVFSYLEFHPNSVIEVITFADSIFNNKEELLLKFKEFYSTAPNRHWFTNVSRSIEGLMRKCIKKFKIPSELTPNFNEKMIDSEINFYIMSLGKNDLTEEAFKERVEPLCEGDDLRKIFLIDNLLNCPGTRYLAEYYCNLYNINVKIPKVTKRVELEGSYHTVDNLLDMIVFVDSEQSGNSMIDYIDSLVNSKCSENSGSNLRIPVGLDTEWKSICGFNIVRPPSLLQIAFEKRVYLVDITVLHSCTDFWRQLSDKLLENNRFIKLGYGLHGDQCKFDYYPNLSFINLSGRGFLDLLKEEKKYDKNTQIKFPFDIAMDAYCLIEVYDVLKGMHKESNLRFSVLENMNTQSNKAKNRPENMRLRRRFFRRRYFRNYRKKIEVSVQASVEYTDAFTQTIND